jgi:Fe-S-cluster containining protein
MTEEERLGRLVQELGGDPGYASGRRSFPRTVTAEDAVSIAGALTGEIDRGCEARARAAERDRVKIACGRGCNGCCQEPILVYLPESVRVATWLARPENSAARAAFLAAYPIWQGQVGDGPEKLAALTVTGDVAAFKAAHVAEWRKQALCAFNRGGDCSIYPVRPGVCRNAHAVDTSEHCSGGSPKPATRLEFIPLDTFMERARLLLRAAHHAMGGPRGRPQPLCDEVHRLLSTQG